MSGEWLQWYYLIYTLPAGVAVLLLLASGVGGHATGAHHGLPGGAPSLHGPVPAGHLPGPVTHGAAAHAPAAGGHSIQAAAHGHSALPRQHGMRSNAGERTSLAAQVLGFFGIGRAPITIVLGSMCLGWGIAGLTATQMLRAAHPDAFQLPAMGVAAAGGLLFAKVFGEISERLLPKEESSALTREDLVGLTATVVYPISETSGRIHVFDAYRTLHVEPARLLTGPAPGAVPDTVPRGATVRIRGLDPQGRYLLVEPADAPQDTA